MSEGTSRISCRCFLFMMAGSVLVLLADGSATLEAQVTKESAQTDRDAAKLPPWQRLLKGEDARKAEALEKQYVELQKKGQFAAAVTPAHQDWEIRRRLQGDDHWQTVRVRREEETCARVARLDGKAQAEFARIFEYHEEGVAST